jgi:hypothetical protein
MEAVGTVVAEEEVASMAVVEVVAFTAVVVEEAAISAAAAVTLAAEEHPAPALVGVDSPLAQALFAGLFLARMARMGPAGRALTAIDLMVHDLMGCTVAEARLRQVLVTALCRGTELIQR